MPDPNRNVTVATFLYLARRAGVPLADASVEAACAGLDTAGPADLVARGEALVAAIGAHLDGDDVRAAVAALVGEDHLRPSFATEGTREERIAAVRRASFGHPLPFLARIVDRSPTGTVGVHWVLVEDVREEVSVMDPNPWDDLPEARSFPIGDFMVRWELAGGESVRVG